MEQEFYDRTLKEGHDGEALGEICEHWCYEDFQLSKTLCQQFLKGLNDIEYDAVKPFYETLGKMLQIQDSIQRLRFEWLFGFAVPKCLRKVDSNFPYYGSHAISYIDDEVFIFPSPLFYGPVQYETIESILVLL